MPKYLIEREIPGISGLSADEFKAIAERSNGIIAELGPDIQWIHSYVSGDKIYCLYRAPSAQYILDHAERGNFPANSIVEVTGMIDPTTAE